MHDEEVRRGSALLCKPLAAIVEMFYFRGKESQSQSSNPID